MAFTQTKGRYASFGTVTSLPKECIDTIWFIIDNYLKNVIPLKHIISFQLQNKHGKLCFVFSQEGYKQAISVDSSYAFDPFFPKKLLVLDHLGDETVVLPHEINSF